MVMTTEGHAGTKADALEERLVEFAVGVIPIANRLSESFSGRHLAHPRHAQPPGADCCQ